MSENDFKELIKTQFALQRSENARFYEDLQHKMTLRNAELTKSLDLVTIKVEKNERAIIKIDKNTGFFQWIHKKPVISIPIVILLIGIAVFIIHITGINGIFDKLINFKP